MSWVTTTGKENCIPNNSNELLAVLTVGSEAYGKHTEWFLKHRETALKQLAILITAELAIQNLVVEPEGANLPARMLLLLLAFMSLLLAHAGWRNCQQAFTAAMENVLLVNKIIWSMAPSGKVHLAAPVDVNNMPCRQDETLYVPRFLKHSIDAYTTEAFVQENLSIRKGFSRSVGWIHWRKNSTQANTYFWTTVLIWSLGLIGAALGVMCFATGT